MKISVKTHGKKISLELAKDEYWIDDIKRKVNTEIYGDAHPLCDICLLVQKGKHEEYLKLDEGRTLADFNIRDKGTVYLLGPREWPSYYRGSWGISSDCVNLIKRIKSSCS